MQKLSLLIIAAIAITACTAPTNTNTNTPPANTSTAATTNNALSEDDLIAKEKASWTALEKKDYAAFGNMLAPEYTEVGDTNVFDKPSVLEFVKDLELSNSTFSDWKVLKVTKDLMVVTYSVSAKSFYKGKEEPAGPYRASAAWLNRDGKWLSVYFQETLAGSAPTPGSTPAPLARPAPKAPTAGPTKEGAATATAAEPSEHVANEKLIWEALKRKDYDTFASYLDDASIEVEADGVYDKSGSVKAVQAIDLSRSEISEFKTVGLGTDAALVTYVAKLTPKVRPERSSTIWVRRDGKWRAIFHQGTPAMPPAGKQ